MNEQMSVEWARSAKGQENWAEINLQRHWKFSFYHPWCTLCIKWQVTRAMIAYWQGPTTLWGPDDEFTLSSQSDIFDMLFVPFRVLDVILCANVPHESQFALTNPQDKILCTPTCNQFVSLAPSIAWVVSDGWCFSQAQQDSQSHSTLTVESKATWKMESLETMCSLTTQLFQLVNNYPFNELIHLRFPEDTYIPINSLYSPSLGSEI